MTRMFSNYEFPTHFSSGGNQREINRKRKEQREKKHKAERTAEQKKKELKALGKSLGTLKERYAKKL